MLRPLTYELFFFYFLVEHCSTNRRFEAMGSNPVEALNFFLAGWGGGELFAIA